MSASNPRRRGFPTGRALHSTRRPNFRALYRGTLAFIGALVLLAARPSEAHSQVDLVLNVSDAGFDPIPAGGTIKYAVRVDNNGTTTATGVTFTLAIPAGGRYVGTTGPNFSCTPAAPVSGPLTVSCTGPNLPAAAFSRDTILVKALAAGQIIVTGNVTSTQPDAATGDNTVSETTTIVAGADASINVTAPASAASGSTISYALSVSNAGPDAASSLSVTFTVPTGFTITAALPAGCSIAGSTVTCAVAGPIASGATQVIGNITGQITAASGSTISGAASVAVSGAAPGGTPQDPNSSNNTVPFTTSVNPGSDVKVTVARSSAGPYFVGGAFNFVITPTFTGSTPTGLTITDVIPANYTINTGTFATSQNGWTCTVSGQTVTCTKPTGAGTGANIALGTISIPVTVATAGAGVVNTVTITSTSPADPDGSNNTANDGGANLQVATADLQIVKSGPTPALAVIGQPFTYTLSVHNNGPSAFFGTLVVADTVPAGLQINSYGLNGWTCAPAAPVTGPSVITCQRVITSGAPLASGGNSPSFTLNATALAAGALNNKATVASPDANVPDNTPGNDVTTTTITASTGPNAADIRVNKTVDLAAVPAGSVLTYTIEVVNTGTVTSSNITVADTLLTLINNSVGATGAGYVGQTVTQGAAVGVVTCSTSASGSAGRILNCSIPSLPVCTAGVNCPKIDVQIRPGGDGGVRTNSATAISQSTADPDLTNNSGSVSSTVLARADIQVTKSASPTTVPAGQPLVYTVAAHNNGPSAAAGVTVTDVLPVGVLFVSAPGSCTTTPGVGVVTTGGNRTLICSLGTINNNVTQSLTITVKATDATSGTTIINTATGATTTTETDATNNVGIANVNVTPPVLDLTINNTDSVDPLTVGSNTVYTVTVGITGQSDAELLVLTDSLPVAGLTFQSFTAPAGATCTAPAVGSLGGVVTCTLPRLSSGSTSVLTITAQGVAKGIFTNIARVASAETGITEDPSNNRATQNTTVRTRADLTVESKTPSVPSIGVRQPFNFVIHVRNLVGAGLAEADSVNVGDNFPAGLELTGTPTVNVTTGTTTLSSCTGAAGATSFTCALGTVSNGAQLDITAPVRATAVPGTNPLTNSAFVSTTSQDPVSANNSHTGTVIVNGSSVSGLVFRDFNNNGASDAGDTGISGITLSLSGTAFDGAAVSTTTTTTGADGSFTFSGLPQGTYNITRGTVSEPFLTQGIQTAGNRGGNATTPPNITGIVLGDLDAGSGYRFAFVPQARIGLAKRVSTGPSSNADASYTAVLRIVARNYSLETLNGVNITDPLSGAAPLFGTYVAGGAGAALTPGTYTINAAPSFNGACAGGTVNAAFDGTASQSVAQITAFASGVSCDVQFTLRYQPTVPLPGGGYTNQANVTSTGALSGQVVNDLSQNGTDPDPDGDSNPANNNVPTPLATVLVADVTTSVAFPATVNAGQPVNGTVVFRNNGPYAASGVTYLLTLTSGLTGVSFGNLPAGATAVYNTGTGIVSFTGMPATLAFNQIASGNGTSGITVAYTQNSVANTSINSGIGTSTNQGANAAPDAANATVGGALIADVTTSLAFPGTADAGTAVNGTVVFQNNGPSIASGTTFTLTLTPGLTNVTFGNLPAGATASYASGTGVVTFTGMPATLAPAAIASGNGTTGITVSYTQNGTPSSTITSGIGTSTNQGANVAPDNATVTITGNPIADVTTSLSFPVNVNAGDPVTGTIVYRNTGPSIAQGMTYTLQLTPGLAGVTLGNLPAGVTATYNGGTGAVTFTGMPATLTINQIASGNGTSGITLTYTQPGTATSSITSTIATTTNEGANTQLNSANATPGGGLVADVRTIVSFPSTVNAGQPVNGTVQFSNNGPSIASGVTYALQLTTGLTGVTFGNLPAGATATYNPATGAVTFTGMPVTLAVNAIASGDGITGITVQYTQPGSATSTVMGTIGTTTSQGANIAPDVGTATINGNPIADVTTTVSFPALVSSGSAVSGTVVYTNNGPSSGAGMTYGLTLNTGLTGVTFGNLPAGATATYNSATGVVTFTGMPATVAINAIVSGNGTSGITVSYTQPPGGTSTVTSTIGTTTSQGANAAPDTATATILGEADVTTTLAFPLTVNAGNPVSGTVVFRNNGPSAGANVTYTLTLTPGLFAPTFANLPAGATASYNAATGVVTFTGMPASLVSGQIASGNGTTGIVVTYTQPSTATSTVSSTIGTSTSQGANVAPDNATVIITGGLVSDLAVTKTTTATSAQNGQTITYTLRLTNNGPSNVPGGSTLTDTPTGLQITGVACSVVVGNTCGTAPTPAQLTAGVTMSQLFAGQFYEVIVSAKVTVATGTVSNSATAVVAPGTIEPNLANNTATAGPTPVVAGPNLAITKVITGAFGAGAQATYTIGVTNNGLNPTTGATTVTDVLPTGLTFVSGTGTGWTCAAVGQTVTCTTATILASAASTSIALVVNVAANTSSTVSNTATVSTPGDLPGGPKSATATITLGSAPNLGLVKTIATDSLRIGAATSYSLVITNSGSGPTTGPITVTDAIPAGLTPTSATGTGFTCAITGQNVSCTRSTVMNAAESATITVGVTGAAGLTGTSITNQACVQTVGDTVAANDCGSVTTPIGGRKDLTIRKDAIGDFVVGQPGTFRLVVRNPNAGVVAGPITVTDTLPNGVAFTSATGSGWTCTGANGIVSCNNSGSLALNDSSIITVVAKINAPAAPQFINCAVVTAPGINGLGANNRSCVTVRPRVDYRLVLQLSTPRYERELGDNPDFTVLVTNVGSSPLTDVVLTNTLPAGFVYVPGTSYRGNGRISPLAIPDVHIADPSGGRGPAISWPLGNMDPGQIIRIVYKANIRVGASFNQDNVTGSHAVSLGTVLASVSPSPAATASLSANALAVNVESNSASVPIILRRGLFDNRGTVEGKIYMRCSCGPDTTQKAIDLGIPGVRVIMEDGTGAITDAEGKYNFIAVRAGLHVVKVDRTTLPAGSELFALDTRNAGDPYSRFVDLKGGELHRADFAEGSRSQRVMAEVIARRTRGDAMAADDSIHATPLMTRNTVITTPMAQAIPDATGIYVPVLGTTMNPGTASVTGQNSFPTANLVTSGNSNLPPTPDRADARIIDKQSFARRSTIEVAVSRNAVPADGHSITPVHIRALDADGRQIAGNVAITLETTAGVWTTSDLDDKQLGTQVVLVNGEGTFNLIAAREPVVAHIRAQSDIAQSTVNVSFVPVPRPFIAAGLLQGRLDMRSFSRGNLNSSAIADGFEESLNSISFDSDTGKVHGGARGALYMKGDVPGIGTMTLQYDSENDRLRGEFRDIQPDNFFPIYGDAALREFDAQTSQRFFLRVDRGTSFLRYGDFTTTRSDDRRLLLAYNRSLTGLLNHTEGRFGVLNAFISQSHAKLTVDELHGRGLSGPYMLTRLNAITNSERVEIITRDRNQPALILKSQLMTRFEDYTLDPTSGNLLFKAPVPSLDANLNPVSIRVSYELDQGGPNFLTYGGDATARLGSNLEVGGFVARDENPVDGQLLSGGSLTAKLGDGSFLLGEYAHTNSDALVKNGDAWRLELRHQSKYLEGRIYGVQSDTNYINPSSTFVSGRKEYGARFAATVSASSRVIGEALHTEDVRTGGNRDGALLSFEQRFNDMLIGEVGYRWSDESTLPASLLTVGASPISTNALRARVTARVPNSTKSSVFGEYEQSLDDAAHRVSIGGEYLLSSHTRVYGRQEWISALAGPYALNDQQYQQNTVFGVDADVLRNSQLFSEYRLRDAITGRDAEASVGLRNRWPLAKGILANTSFERVSSLAGAGQGRAFAITGGLEFTQSPLWKGSTRLEWRNTTTGDDYLASLGYARKLSRDFTGIARGLFQQLNTDEQYARSQIGIAWRQTDGNNTNALFRIENHVDRTLATGGGLDREVANIAALLVNTHPLQHLTLSGRYAGKLAYNDHAGLTTQSTAQLAMGRAIFDLSSRVDVGIIGSALGDGSFDQRQYGVGAEVGLIVMRNLRLAGGYNVFGFTDKDFASLGYTQRGPYIEFGFKFDEGLLGVGAPQRKP